MALPDYNRTSNGASLPTPIAQEIITKAREASLVMQKAQRKTLVNGAAAFTEFNGVSGSKFVGETERKPQGTASYGDKVMRAKKIALILSFSTEFKRDKAALYRAIVADMPKDLAATFDMAVLHGVGAPTGGEFDTFASSPTKALGTGTAVYTNMLSALGTVAAAGGNVTEFDMASQGEVGLLGAVDSSGRPILTAGVSAGTVGGVLGRPVYVNQNVYLADTAGATGGAKAETLGFGVDWNAQFWGMVEGVQYQEYDGPIYNAAGTSLVHAGAQDNMFSVICEMEVAFRGNPNKAVRLIGADA